MKKTQSSPSPTCAVDYAFQRIGGKYKGRIINALREEVLRYGELRRAISDITPKMLTQALRELEDDKLIARKVYLEVPPRVEYQLTSSGREFLPVIKLIADWGARQMKSRNLECIEPWRKEAEV